MTVREQVLVESQTRLRLSRWDGDREMHLVEVQGCRSPAVERLADGRWLVVACNAEPGEPNARLFEPNGEPIRSFHVGDAIAHVVCTPHGTICVGQFDEHAGGDAGLAAYDASGERLWVYSGDEHWLLDCYALSTSGEEVWACTYVDFPILRAVNGVVRSWENTVFGPNSIAAKGEHVILAGGYRDDEARVRLLRLADRVAEPVAEFRWPDLSTAGAFASGRDGVLHAVIGRE